MELTRAATSYVSRTAGTTPGALMSAKLVADFAWSERTTTARNSQWKTWLMFCQAEGRTPLPVTEAHIIAFIGWLKIARDRGERTVGSTSIPQYLSAVRQMQLVLTGEAVPSFPFVGHVLRAYRKWEEANHPAPDVRCGIPAEYVQRMWCLGMTTESLPTLRDCAVCVFAFCFNGLRESSVLSMQTAGVRIDEPVMSARLCVVKGRQASKEQLVAYHRLSSFSSPLDLLHRWNQARGRHARFFALPGEATDWPRQGMTDACKRVLEALGLCPPAGGKYTSNSLRIGSHTEQVLLGVPLEVRLARFGWGKDSDDMAAMYFDRTLRTTAASFWFFGPTAGARPASIPPAPEA